MPDEEREPLRRDKFTEGAQRVREPEANPSADEAESLVQQLGQLLGSELRGLVGRDLSEVLGELRGLVEAYQSGDETRIAEARAAAKDLGLGLEQQTRARLEDLPDQLEGLKASLEPERLAGHLRTLAGWLDGSDPEAGEKVDELVEELDAGVGGVLAGEKRAAEEAQTQRIRSDVSANIAAALSKVGITLKRSD